MLLLLLIISTTIKHNNVIIIIIIICIIIIIIEHRVPRVQAPVAMVYQPAPGLPEILQVDRRPCRCCHYLLFTAVDTTLSQGARVLIDDVLFRAMWR